jgi:hypothetical protein
MTFYVISDGEEKKSQPVASISEKLFLFLFRFPCSEGKEQGEDLSRSHRKISPRTHTHAQDDYARFMCEPHASTRKLVLMTQAASRMFVDGNKI